jgi:hypothetical protein
MMEKTWTSSVKYETKGTIQAICFRSGVVDELWHFWIYNQLDALFQFFQCIYFSTSTCFRRQVLIIRRQQLYQYILWYNTLVLTSTSDSHLASVLYQRMY